MVHMSHDGDHGRAGLGVLVAICMAPSAGQARGRAPIWVQPLCELHQYKKGCRAWQSTAHRLTRCKCHLTQTLRTLSRLGYDDILVKVQRGKLRRVHAHPAHPK